MNSNFTIPTDNIYKFYAIFGIVIIITTAVMFFIRHEEYNKRAFERYVPMQLLIANQNLNDRQKLELHLYEQQATIDKSNKEFELSIYLLIFVLLGIALTCYGFYKWHTEIQPIHDEKLKLQLERDRIEVEEAKKAVQQTSI